MTAADLARYYDASYPPSLWEPPAAALIITSPQPGADVPPVHDVIGTGPIGETVSLWYTHSDFPGQDRDTGATDQIGPLGTFLFVGDSAMAPGDVEWFVRDSQGRESPRVPVTVVEAEPPTGVTAGTPGAFTPAGAAVPATIGDLRALALLDAGTDAAWAEGEYVVIGSGNVHWNGDDWAMGVAS